MIPQVAHGPQASPGAVAAGRAGDRRRGVAADRAMSAEAGVIIAMLAIFVVLAAVMIWRRDGPHSGEPPGEP
jgi:hypothetical protein